MLICKSAGLVYFSTARHCLNNPKKQYVYCLMREKGICSDQASFFPLVYSAIYDAVRRMRGGSDRIGSELCLDRGWSDGDTKRSVYQFDKPVPFSQRRLTKANKQARYPALHAQLAQCNLQALQTASSVPVSARFLKSQQDKFISHSLSLSLSKMRGSGGKKRGGPSVSYR
jgi:hypothetical protein